MAKPTSNDLEMRFMLLQESVWNNGDKLSRILEHVISQEAQLLKLVHVIEMAMQRLGLLMNGTKPQRKKRE